MKEVPKYVNLAFLIAVIAVAYVCVTASIYRFKHPKLTETELFLHLPDAMRFK